jgi:hypothetical protein
MFTFPTTKNRRHQATTDILRSIIHRWRFDEGTGSSVEDSIGSNNGTVGGGTSWGEGQVGTYSGDFDGVDSVVVCSGVANMTENYSATAWIKTTTSAEGAIIGKNVLGDRSWVLMVTSGGKALAALQLAGGGVVGTLITSTSDVNTGDWIHVAFTRAGDVIKLYIDGVLEDSSSDSKALFNDSTTGDFQIGRQEPSGTTRYFNGLIDDVRIYNEPLTDEEVLYLATRANRK